MKTIILITSVLIIGIIIGRITCPPVYEMSERQFNNTMQLVEENHGLKMKLIQLTKE